MVVRLPETKKYLNRDGLEEYNSMLPHSSGEMQEYVNDWLDEHPEATTTVQDGAISEPKLADKSVSLRTLADDTVHMLNGMMITREISGSVLSADDAYSAPPVSLTVDGKSTQDGTPTPENPVPIQSIEVLELPVTFIGKNIIPDFIGNGGFIADMYYTVSGNTVTLTNDNPFSYAMFIMPWPAGEPITFSQTSNKVLQVAWFSEYPVLGSVGKYKCLSNSTVPRTASAESTDGWLAVQSRFVNDFATYHMQGEWGTTATAYEPYNATTVLIPMQGHVLRSLPDGTKDTLELSYLRPSTREGWAVYSRELVQRVHEITLNTCAWLFYSTTAFYTRGLTLPYTQGAVEVLCNIFKASASKNLGGLANAEINSTQVLGRNELGIRTADEYQDAAAFVASLDDSDIAVVKLTTPVTTTLDPIELPVLPAPTCTVWADPSTGLKMSYMRDANIVVSNIEQAIADL